MKKNMLISLLMISGLGVATVQAMGPKESMSDGEGGYDVVMEKIGERYHGPSPVGFGSRPVPVEPIPEQIRGDAGRMADVFNPAALGNFAESCEVSSYDTRIGSLSCTCKNEAGAWSGATSYNIAGCKPGSIQNINGVIGCDLSDAVIPKTCEKIFGQPCCMLTPTMRSEKVPTPYYPRYRGHGPAMRMLPRKPLTAAQRLEWERERLEEEQRYQKEVAAAEKVAIVFPDFTDQCAVLEKKFSFLAGDNNWKKVKNFLLPRAGKEYHRNLTDRGMLINLMMAITNRNGERQWLVNNSAQWNSFWWDVLKNTTELVYSSEETSIELD